MEVDMQSPHVLAFDEQRNLERLSNNLDLIDELRDQAYIRLEAYHRRVAKYYNTRVWNRALQLGDLVLRK